MVLLKSATVVFCRSCLPWCSLPDPFKQRSHLLTSRSLPPAPLTAAFFPKLPKHRWAREIVRCTAPGRRCCQQEKGGLPFMEGLGFFLGNSSKVLLSNGIFPPPTFQALPTGAPTQAPPTLSLPMAPPAEAAEGALS